MTGYIHAEVMRQYAEDAAETDRPWERWEFNGDGRWFPMTCHPFWTALCSYRRKSEPKRTFRESLEYASKHSSYLMSDAIKSKLMAILQATGVDIDEYDEILSVKLLADEVEFTVQKDCHGDKSRYTLYVINKVIDAEDPLKAAERWYKEQRLYMAKSRLEYHTRGALEAAEEIKRLEKELCDHDWVFDQASSDGLSADFSCRKCGFTETVKNQLTTDEK